MSSQLPVDWKYLPMEAIAEKKYAAIVDGPFGSNLKTSDYVPFGIPVLQGKNITNDRFKWFDIRFISPEKAQDIIRSSVKVGDILLVKIGSVGYSAVVDDLGDYEFAIIPANLMKVSLDENICSSRYIHHYLTSPTGKQRLVDAASSTAQPALSLSILKKYRVPLPPLPEQQKIAAILTSVDDVIESTQAQINKLKDLKTGMMQELLTKGIGHTEFKDSVVGRIPKGWEVVKTGEVTRSIVPGRNKPKSLDGELPWITISDLDQIEVSRSKNGFGVSREVLADAGGKTIPKNSVVMTVVGEFGVSAVAQTELVINQQLHAFVCDERIVPMFLCLLIRFKKSELEKLATQTTIAYMNKENTESLYIPLPTVSEQIEISKTLISADQVIVTLSNKMSQVIALKKALMQDLLTGKVRVKVN